MDILLIIRLPSLGTTIFIPYAQGVATVGTRRVPSYNIVDIVGVKSDVPFESSIQYEKVIGDLNRLRGACLKRLARVDRLIGLIQEGSL